MEAYFLGQKMDIANHGGCLVSMEMQKLALFLLLLSAKILLVSPSSDVGEESASSDPSELTTNGSSSDDSVIKFMDEQIQGFSRRRAPEIAEPLNLNNNIIENYIHKNTNDTQNETKINEIKEYDDQLEDETVLFSTSSNAEGSDSESLKNEGKIRGKRMR